MMTHIVRFESSPRRDASLKLSGSYPFQLSQEKLWDLMMDSSLLAACIPGVREFTPQAGDAYSFELGIRVGPVGAVYKGSIEVTDKVWPRSYRLTVSGSGARTTVRGMGDIALEPAGEASSTLRFDGDVQVAGALTRVGQRLLTTVARAQINQFFECLQAKAASA